MRTALKVILGIAALVLVVLYIVPYFVPLDWSWNITYISMDITCGRLRHERYLCGIKIGEWVEETPLSRAYRRLIGDPGKPQWRNALSGCSYALINYTHGSSLCAARQLTNGCETGRFSQDAQRQAILNFFDLLQNDDTPARAEQYVYAIQSLPERPENEIIEISDLPPLSLDTGWEP